MIILFKKKTTWQNNINGGFKFFFRPPLPVVKWYFKTDTFYFGFLYFYFLTAVSPKINVNVLLFLFSIFYFYLFIIIFFFFYRPRKAITTLVHHPKTSCDDGERGMTTRTKSAHSPGPNIVLCRFFSILFLVYFFARICIIFN